MMHDIISRTVGKVVKLAHRFRVLNKIARLAEGELDKLFLNLFLSGTYNGMKKKSNAWRRIYDNSYRK